MLTISNKSATALRAVQRQCAAGMATAAPRIGDTKVPMSLLEKNAFINYQRIEDNLAVVRERSVLFSLSMNLVLTLIFPPVSSDHSPCPRRFSTDISTTPMDRTSLVEPAT